MNATRVIGVALSLCASAAHGDEIQSTWTGFFDGVSWEEPGNWNNDPAVNAYPNNGNLGHTYVVTLGLFATLSQEVTVSGLTFNTGGGIAGPGVITVEGPSTFNGPTGGFYGGGGTYDPIGDVEVPGAMRVEGWTVDGGTIYVGTEFANGAIVLDAAATFEPSVIDFRRNGTMTAQDGAASSFVMDGSGTLVKSGGTGSTDITCTTDLFGCSIECTSGFLRFMPSTFTAPVTIEDCALTSWALSHIVFGRDTCFVGDTSMTLEGGTIQLIAGDHVNNGRMFTTFEESGAFQLIGGSLTGGVIDAQPTTPFEWRGGEVNDLTIDGNVDWTAGTVGSGGLTIASPAEAEAGTEGGIGGRSVEGQLTIPGHFRAGHLIIVSNDGSVRVEEGGKLEMKDGTIRHVGDGPTSPTLSLESGTILGTGSNIGTFDIDVMTDEGMIDVQTGTVVFATGHTATIDGTNISLGADAEVDFEGTTEIRGVVSAEGVTGGDGTIEFFGGAHTIEGRLHSTVEIGVSGGAVVMGGEVSGSSQALMTLEDGRLVGVTNSIQLDVLRAGAVLENVQNEGHVRFVASGTGAPATIDGTFLNMDELLISGSVTQSATVQAPGSSIINQERWTVDAPSLVRLTGGASPVAGALFDNSESLAEFIKEGTGTCVVEIPFDNESGSVLALEGILEFQQAMQYDESTGSLEGGNWAVAGTGVIRFPGPLPLTIISPQANVTLQGGGSIEGIGNLAEINGALAVEHGGTLTIQGASVNGELGDGESIQLGAASTIDAQFLDVSGILSVPSIMTVTSANGIDLENGLLRGGGLVVTPLVDVVGGTISPGYDEAPFEVATLTIDGDVGFDAGSTLAIEIGDVGHDAIDVSGTATLDGALVVTTLPDHTPQAGATHDVLAGANVGAFTSLSLPPGFAIEYLADRVRVTAPNCPGDLDGDGSVAVSDLLLILAAWGTRDGDLDGDGTTAVGDILVLLANWGACS